MARYLTLTVICLILGACARAAPELPPDYGSVSSADTLAAEDFSRLDLALTCVEARSEQQALVSEADGLTGVIRSNRGHNQAAGYFGGLFLFPLLAAENNGAEKARLDRMQTRWDQLEALKRFKSCADA